MSIALTLIAGYGAVTCLLALGLCRAAALGSRVSPPPAPRAPDAPGWVLDFAERAPQRVAPPVPAYAPTAAAK